MGFVHHSIYLQYFEIARTELYRASGGNYRDFESSGLFVVVVKVECNYKQPAKYDDLLSVRVTIDRMTEAKIVQSYVVSRTSPQSGDSFGDSSIGAASAPEQLNPDAERPTDIIVTAKVTLAVVDRTGKAQRIPDTLRNPGSAESR